VADRAQVHAQGRRQHQHVHLYGLTACDHPVFQAGANPTIASHNASVVNSYNTTSSLARSEIKSIFLFFEKRSSLLQRWRRSCKFGSRGIGSSIRRSSWVF
jgi:hypothetical protein